MYRQVFIPSENNSAIPFFNIPQEWYGNEVEIIVFPVKNVEKTKIESQEEKLSKLCGAWVSEKSAEEIIADIYNSRSSGNTRIIEEL